MKTAFINNISHEIRTPLNGIPGFGEMLAESDFPAEQRTEMLEQVQLSIKRLMNTVSDYTDMARIVSGTIDMRRKEFD
ncbi:MAG: histidine kinase dimerization/phospho-acceptor domain-containing protein [Bacteroidota bacterium]|nr:histidine kinase dimerization/phospho-acceptor domain-containing protein [Bacteroidota bacterium]